MSDLGFFALMLAFIGYLLLLCLMPEFAAVCLFAALLFGFFGFLVNLARQ